MVLEVQADLLPLQRVATGEGPSVEEEVAPGVHPAVDLDLRQVSLRLTLEIRQRVRRPGLAEVAWAVGHRPGRSNVAAGRSRL